MLIINQKPKRQIKLPMCRIKTQKNQVQLKKLNCMSERKKVNELKTLPDEEAFINTKFKLRNSQSDCQKSFLKKIIFANQIQRKQLFKNMASKRQKSKQEFSKKKNLFQKQNIGVFIRKSCVQTTNNYNHRLSKRDSQLLKISFNKRIQQIKLRKYFNNKDQIETPKRFFEGYAATLIGTKHSQNQDSTRFSDGIYILCDGHGANGKQLSNFVSESLYNSIVRTLEDHIVDETILKQIFNRTDLELDSSNFDISFSGCTCIAVLRFQNTIICASVGDSKAFIFKGFTVNQISVTHKPDTETQSKRILNYGGVIRQIQLSKDKFIGPKRVWAPGKNSWGPGLALSRAFGDKASRKYGIISTPDITTIKLTSQQQFLIIGSDGLFDFFNEHEIYMFIKRCLKDQTIEKQDICQLVVQEAKGKWPQGQSDDISCILIFM